jgi:hypothetical protein
MPDLALGLTIGEGDANIAVGPIGGGPIIDGVYKLEDDSGFYLTAANDYLAFETAETALWTPSRLESVSLWMDANDSSTITLTSSEVSQWDDKSGNGYNFTQTDANQRPTLGTLNGLTSVQFNLNDAGTATDKLNATSNPLGNVNDSVGEMSLFIAGEVNSLATSGGYFPIIGQNTFYISTYILGQVLARFGSAGQFSSSAGIVSNGDKVLLGFTSSVSASNQEVFLNGTSVASQSVTSSLSVASSFYIHGFTSNGYDNELGEIVMVAGNTLSTSDRQKIEGYLAHKWGMDSNLDSSHPYALSAPTI